MPPNAEPIYICQSQLARAPGDLGYDSLDQVEFMMTIEEEFDITVPNEEAEKITTVRATIEAIRKAIS